MIEGAGTFVSNESGQQWVTLLRRLPLDIIGRAAACGTFFSRFLSVWWVPLILRHWPQWPSDVRCQSMVKKALAFDLYTWNFLSMCVFLSCCVTTIVWSRSLIMFEYADVSLVV